MALQDTNELDEILKRDFTAEFRTGYTTVKGVCMPTRYHKFADEIENFEVKDDDIWVCSFPKTGTTWTQEMIWCIGNDLDFEGAKRRLPLRFPFLEFSTLFDTFPILTSEEIERPPEMFSESVKFAGKIPSPRYIKTHLPFVLLPRQLRTGEKKPKFIYVTRNPKDTCVSYYHHCKLMEGYRGNFHDFCRLFLGDKLNYAPYWEHSIDFWQRRDQPNILFLRYEEMKSDLPKVIQKAAAFLNKTVSSSQIDALVDHLSFSNMKNNKAVNYEEHIKMIKKTRPFDVKGEFIRKGKVNQWKEEMSESVIAQFDKLEKEKFGPHKLSF